MVLGRIVCQLVNEACFALAEGVGSASDIDTAMRLGYNYPRGPLEWADLIELDQVLATLDALYEELREERYRAVAAAAPDGRRGHARAVDGRGLLQIRVTSAELRSAAAAAAISAASRRRLRGSRRARS